MFKYFKLKCSNKYFYEGHISVEDLISPFDSSASLEELMRSIRYSVFQDCSRPAGIPRLFIGCTGPMTNSLSAVRVTFPAARATAEQSRGRGMWPTDVIVDVSTATSRVLRGGGTKP